MKIGDELIFDRLSFNTSRSKWKILLASINEALQYFSEVCLLPVTQEVFDDMARGNIDRLRNNYKQVIRTQMTRSKLTIGAIIDSALKMADEQMDLLQKKVNDFNEVRHSLNNNISANMQLDYEYVSIVKGTAVLKEETVEKIRKTFCTTIENESQVWFYELSTNFQKLYSEIRAFWNDHALYPMDMHKPMIDDSSIFYEDLGKLYFNEGVIETIVDNAGVFVPAIDQLKTIRPKEKTEGQVLTDGTDMPRQSIIRQNVYKSL